MIAATLAGPVLGVWGALVGIAVGYSVAAGLLNVRGAAFWDMFFQMLWARDVSGIVLKGFLFGLLVSWFACYEGLHHGEGPAVNRLDTPGLALRAAVLGTCAVLLGNSAWFLLLYHAGPAFGPTAAGAPPTRCEGRKAGERRAKDKEQKAQDISHTQREKTKAGESRVKSAEGGRR